MPTLLSPASRNGLIALIAACSIIATIVGVDRTEARDESSSLARCRVSTTCSNCPLAPTDTGFIVLKHRRQDLDRERDTHEHSDREENCPPWLPAVQVRNRVQNPRDDEDREIDVRAFRPAS